MSSFPDGVYLDDFIVYYEEGDTDIVISRGYCIELPDVVGVSNDAINSVHRAMEQVLLSIGEDYRMQFRFSMSSQYGEALDKFVTAEPGEVAGVWGDLARSERFSRYSNASKRGEIRREVFSLFISTRIKQLGKLQTTIEGARKGFEIVDAGIKAAFSMGKVSVNDELENFRSMHCYFNPSVRGVVSSCPREELAKLFSPNLSILDSSMRSDGDARMRGKSSFQFDGHYYRLFRLDQWPTRVDGTSFRAFVSEGFDTFEVIANVVKANTAVVEEREEKARKRLLSSKALNDKVGESTRIQESEDLITALSRGEVVPFDVCYMIMVWAESEDELMTRSQELETALSMMSGARADKVQRPRAASEMFASGMPGNVYSDYMGKAMSPSLHNYLAALLPKGASGHGHLFDAEALYDGPGRKLFGVQLFSGGSPRHGVVVGGTGSGKSCWVGDFISQASRELDRIVIVDEGNSHGSLARALGGTSVVVRPDAGITINYLDTFGMPLSASHMSTAKAFLLQMLGDIGNGKDGYLGNIVANSYEAAADDWLKYNDHRVSDLLDLAAAMRCRMDERSLPKGEVWSSWVDAVELGESAQWLQESNVSPEFRANYEGTDDGQQDLLLLAYTEMERGDVPTHSKLIDSILVEGDRFQLVDTLREWSNGGSHGGLFDGQSTVNLGDPVIHIELGEIPESDKKLKTLAMFAVQSLVRDSILASGRGGKKLVVFEELARLVGIDGVTEIVAEGYAQLRKHGCAVLTVFQQYSQVSNTWLGDVLAANTANWFLLRQQSETEVALIRDRIGVPETLAAQVRNFPLAADLPPGDRYSMVCVFGGNTEGNENGLLIHRASPEMLAATTTDGASYEKRIAFFETWNGTFVDGLFEFANQQSIT